MPPPCHGNRLDILVQKMVKFKFSQICQKQRLKILDPR